MLRRRLGLFSRPRPSSFPPSSRRIKMVEARRGQRVALSPRPQSHAAVARSTALLAGTRCGLGRLAKSTCNFCLQRDHLHRRPKVRVVLSRVTCTVSPSSRTRRMLSGNLAASASVWEMSITREAASPSSPRRNRIPWGWQLFVFTCALKLVQRALLDLPQPA